MKLTSGSPLAAAAVFPAVRVRYEERALLARHSFAERKRMQGQKPLRFPGAWQEYLSAAWTPARCPHVHRTRANSGEIRAARPRPATAGLAFRNFLLVTVPLSL
jgi:hypothetical protein